MGWDRGRGPVRRTNPLDDEATVNPDGEDPNGDWQIEVFDADANDTGDLEAWRLKIYYGEHPEEDQGGDGGDIVAGSGAGLRGWR